jgi:hypothetical protein
MEHPDPKKHLQVSLFKSGLRILAGTALVFGGSGPLVIAGALLVLAEIAGIVEELV